MSIRTVMVSLAKWMLGFEDWTALVMAYLSDSAICLSPTNHSMSGRGSASISHSRWSLLPSCLMWSLSKTGNLE